MRTEVRYVAHDGSEFKSVTECEAYERLCAEIADVCDILPPVGPLADEASVQLNPSNVLAMQRGLVEIFEREHPEMKDQHTEWARNASVPAGLTIIGRYIDDCGGPLRSAWWRITCIGADFRQYSQPFYARRTFR